jgi:hypothetical protein
VTRSLVRAYPLVLALALCLGLALANVLPRAPTVVAAAGALSAAAAVAAQPRARLALVAAALLTAGWWWGGVRLDGLARTVLGPRAGDTALALVETTGPTRRGRFALRVPASVRRFGDLVLDEPVLLELPLGRSPPQGTRLELVERVRRPRAAERGFDERAWLARRGAHAVLVARSWRPVGRRGGLAGLGDRLHSHVAASVAPGQSEIGRAHV